MNCEEWFWIWTAVFALLGAYALVQGLRSGYYDDYLKRKRKPTVEHLPHELFDAVCMNSEMPDYPVDYEVLTCACCHHDGMIMAVEHVEVKAFGRKAEVALCDHCRQNGSVEFAQDVAQLLMMTPNPDSLRTDRAEGGYV